MARFERSDSSYSSSASCSLDLTLTVESPSGNWWSFVTHDAQVQWQEEGVTLYQIRDGVWVLHCYPPDSPHVTRAETVLKDGTIHTHSVLAGTAHQIDAYAAADWLLKHRYDLPLELESLGKEIRAIRRQIPDASPMLSSLPTAKNGESEENTGTAGTLETSDCDNWITVSQAQQVSAINKGVISRAAKAGEVKTNGKDGRARRLHAGSLAQLVLQRSPANEPTLPYERVIQEAREAKRKLGVVEDD